MTVESYENKPASLSFLSAVSCGIPEAPGNGSFTGNEFTLDNKVMYECNEGFRLEASQQASAVCREDGTWSNRGKTPACKRECSRVFAHLCGFSWEPNAQGRAPGSKEAPLPHSLSRHSANSWFIPHRGIWP